MGWKKSTTTKHDCGGVVFGKKTSGCPRCDELIAGAEPVKWVGSINDQKKRQQDFLRALNAHNCKSHGCLSICVAFDY
jgi:hypothetical protein